VKLKGKQSWGCKSCIWPPAPLLLYHTCHDFMFLCSLKVASPTASGNKVLVRAWRNISVPHRGDDTPLFVLDAGGMI